MNEKEILANNIELLTKGAIEKGNIDTCMIFGISGNCGKNCPKFKDKTCEEYLTTLENEYNSLQQENEQLKKQKADVVEYIKNNFIEGEVFYSKAWLKMKKDDLLRMLGEKNVED